MNNTVGPVQMKHSKKSVFAEQIRRFRARFVQCGGAVLERILTGQGVRELVLEEAGGWRERLYGPLTTVGLFLEQGLGADPSGQDTVARGLSVRVSQGQAPCSLNTGPYCKARQRLSVGLLERLGQEVGVRLMRAQPAQWLWRGRSVKLVDGATVSMPDTLENQAVFPQSRAQKSGLGFPLARLLGLLSLSRGAVLDGPVARARASRRGRRRCCGR